MGNSIPLSFPDITSREINAVTAVMRSGRLSMGPRLEAFEQAVAERTGRRHGVGVSSGTAGLHLALLALGVGPGDEVITPAFSFVASANCILYAGAKPVFVDCDPRTLNMRVSDVEAAITERTKAIIGVEIFGNPAGMRELAALAARHEIPLVEDACEGIGSVHAGEPVGRFGRVAVFGFYPNKQITTGEGGMLVTDDDRLAAVCRSLRNQGRPPQLEAPDGEEDIALGVTMDHRRVGYNYRLSELHAAIGETQMTRLDEIIEMRQRVAENYTRRLMGHSDLILPTIEPETRMSWFVYVVRLTDRFSAFDRDQIIEGLRRHEVGSATYFPVIPLLPFYAGTFGHEPGSFPMAESVSHRTIALPFFTRLTDREIDLVSQTLELMITRADFARR